MACQNVFRRYELKYLLDEQQHTAVMKAVHAHMIPDRYAHSAIRSLYFDTDNYRLARHSIEKPVYKEKLRLLYEEGYREAEQSYERLMAYLES